MPSAGIVADGLGSDIAVHYHARSPPDNLSIRRTSCDPSPRRVFDPGRVWNPKPVRILCSALGSVVTAMESADLRNREDLPALQPFDLALYLRVAFRQTEYETSPSPRCNPPGRVIYAARLLPVAANTAPAHSTSLASTSEKTEAMPTRTNAVRPPVSGVQNRTRLPRISART